MLLKNCKLAAQGENFQVFLDAGLEVSFNKTGYDLEDVHGS